MRFINADLIASGLAPLAPRLAAVAAGRLMLIEMRRLAAARVDFAFESTLSGLGYVRHLKQWQMAGYRIEIAYLRLPSPKMALRRIRLRVRQGGQDAPRIDVVRRFARGWRNFEHIYRGRCMTTPEQRQSCWSGVRAAEQPQGFFSTTFPFSHTHIGVPCRRAVLRASRAASLRASPTSLAN